MDLISFLKNACVTLVSIAISFLAIAGLSRVFENPISTSNNFTELIDLNNSILYNDSNINLIHENTTPQNITLNTLEDEINEAIIAAKKYIHDDPLFEINVTRISKEQIKIESDAFLTIIIDNGSEVFDDYIQSAIDYFSSMIIAVKYLYIDYVSGNTRTFKNQLINEISFLLPDNANWENEVTSVVTNYLKKRINNFNQRIRLFCATNSQRYAYFDLKNYNLSIATTPK